MYIQITDRCNMSCVHCGHNCTTVGNDMDVKTFAQSCKLAVKFHYDICIGGGEPTLHKDFERFLEISLDHSDNVNLVTNGTNTKMSLFLAELAADGIIHCTLSLDKYHDRSMVSQDVINAFQKDTTNKKDHRHIQDVSEPGHRLVYAGRTILSKTKGLIDQEIRDDCFGPGFHVKPDGRLYHCACQMVSYNTVFNPTFHRNIYRTRYTCSERDPWRKYLRMTNDDEDWEKMVWRGY